MSKKRKQKIFIVDDDIILCEAISRTLSENGLQVKVYTNPVTCLEKADFKAGDVIISDVKMPEMDGLEFLTQVRSRAPLVPVLFLTGFGTVSLTVEAFKRGSIDFLEKPISRDCLIHVVESALQRVAPLSQLTRTEIKVLLLIVAGKSSKGTASLLGRAKRTVDFHRMHIMKKLNIRSTVDLCRRVHDMNFA